MIIGIDPGPTHTAWVILKDDGTVDSAEKLPNPVVNQCLREVLVNADIRAVVIESIQSYGKPVGRETFETCYQIGRLIEICDWHRGIGAGGAFTHLYPRQEYVNAICGCKGNDAILRQALLLRFGSDKKGEPLHALKGCTDLRSAFAVAVYHQDRQKWQGNR